MTAFERALKFTVGIEGGYSDDKRDSGGKTRWGITEDKARAWGYEGDMKDLPLELATKIYRTDFWDALNLEQLSAISEPVALELFDTSVNCGLGLPGKHIQRLLNVFNREQADWPDIEVDGHIGTNTLAAMRAFCTRRGNLGVEVFVTALNALQGAFYVDLAERRRKDEAFIFGWFSNRVVKRAE